MSKKDFNPNEVVTRALLLMKYDSNKTLTENQDIVNKPIITESGVEDFATGAGVMGAGALGGAAAGGAVSALAGGTAAGAGALNAITSLSAFGPALANPVGIGVVALTGAFLYAAYRNADNEGVLRKTMEACSTVDKYQKEDELMQDAALDKEAHLQIAQLFYQGVYHRTLGFLAGTDEEKIDKAVKMMKNANVADLCGIIYEYQGEDFADDLAEDLNEADLAPVVTAFRRAASKYSGGGIKVIPDNSFSRKYYQERFPCLYQSKGTVASKVKIDPEGYTYVVIKGKQRRTTSGSPYQKYYRFYAEGQRITTSSMNNQPKDTNATLACVGGRPVAQIPTSGGGSDVEMNESLYETYLRKNNLLEVFDDTGVKVIDSPDIEDNLEGWEEGKKVAPWNIWLKKYPCLKLKFPNVTPLSDEQGYTYFINLNGLNKKKYRFYSDGEIWDENGSKFIKKHWSCPQRGGSVFVESYKKITEQIDFSIEGETNVVSTGGGSTTTDGSSISTTSYKDCSTFPMTKGCQSDKIKEIQGCLKIKTDGKFGSETLTALQSKGYGDSIEQTEYDTIMKDCKPANDGKDNTGETLVNNDPSVG
jgi:hypothetical protein